ncbi:MAG TPA: CcmD family protein [Chitinophagaceae bacterium]|nr:CcmD family protein [Chitinophagaceae bacterium]
MIKLLKKYGLFFFCLFFSTILFAQEKDVSVADTMRSNGRIYVVITVVLTILLGLTLYVIRLDRKISKLEKEGN